MNFRRPRVKNDRHLDFIRSLPCVCCGNNIESEAAHLRMGELAIGKRYTGKSEKPSDCWTIPLCGKHHREQHSMGEAAFWERYDINPFVVCMALYASSGEFEAGEQIISHRGILGYIDAPLSGLG